MKHRKKKLGEFLLEVLGLTHSYEDKYAANEEYDEDEEYGRDGFDPDEDENDYAGRMEKTLEVLKMIETKFKSYLENLEKCDRGLEVLIAGGKTAYPKAYQSLVRIVRDELPANIQTILAESKVSVEDEDLVISEDEKRLFSLIDLILVGIENEAGTDATPSASTSNEPDGFDDLALCYTHLRSLYISYLSLWCSRRDEFNRMRCSDEDPSADSETLDAIEKTSESLDKLKTEIDAKCDQIVSKFSKVIDSTLHVIRKLREELHEAQVAVDKCEEYLNKRWNSINGEEKHRF